jgi:hypothetical protein
LVPPFRSEQEMGQDQPQAGSRDSQVDAH